MPFQDDDDLDPSEYPEPDAEDDDGAETVPCPYCGRPVYEEAEQCPYCEQYVSREDMPSRHPWWLMAGVLACLGVALGWAVGC
jgi:hypothetical protein